MISGLDKSYKEATKVTPDMRKKIEENARKSTIRLTEVESESNKEIEIVIKLSKLVEGSCKVSPIKSVCLLVRILTTCICMIDICTVHNIFISCNIM